MIRGRLQNIRILSLFFSLFSYFFFLSFFFPFSSLSSLSLSLALSLSPRDGIHGSLKRAGSLGSVAFKEPFKILAHSKERLPTVNRTLYRSFQRAVQTTRLVHERPTVLRPLLRSAPCQTLKQTESITLTYTNSRE